LKSRIINQGYERTTGHGQKKVGYSRNRDSVIN